MTSRAALLALAFSSINGALACFLLVAENEAPKEPLDAGLLNRMRRRFLANLDYNGTGAILASPNAVPLLDASCGGGCPGGYRYHWTRDGALSMLALEGLGRAEIPGLAPTPVQGYFSAYVRFLTQVHAENARRGESPAQQPKWNVSTAQPYAGGWCRPQSDGPGLEALALATFLRSEDGSKLTGEEQEAVWALARSDLDWLADGGAEAPSCDLWEETVDDHFLWNKVSTRLGLEAGQALARTRGDLARARRYAARLGEMGPQPLAEHLYRPPKGGCAVAECSPRRSGAQCRKQGKFIEGSAILAMSLLWRAGPRENLPGPASLLAAETLKAYFAEFCALYPVNREDTSRGVPGVLIGRYAGDAYGGNPWILITAALASVLYQAAQSAANEAPAAEVLKVWREVLGAEAGGFSGSVADFLRAGDSVLLRILHHLPSDSSLYEQLDNATGQAVNAKDLTWSYGELFNALQERGRAQSCLTAPERCARWASLDEAPLRRGCSAPGDSDIVLL